LATDDRVYFALGNRTILLRGAVSVFCGDTPAAQLAGGFKEGVAFALKFCRHCEASQDDLQNIFSDDHCVLRTEDRLESHFNRRENFPELAKHFSVNYGLHRKSILHEFLEFKLTEQLPQDLSKGD